MEIKWATPKQFCDLQVSKEIGKGSYGSIYLVVDKQGRANAFKVVSSTYEERAGLRESVLIETDIFFRLYHPYKINGKEIITSRECGDLRDPYGSVGIILPLAESDLFRIKPNISSVEEKFQVLYRIASAISFLHEQGVLYLDIKGDNVLFLTSSQPAITDFGISAFVPNASIGRALSTDHTTPGYEAPEIIAERTEGKFRHYNEKTDVWAFGMLAFYFFREAYTYDIAKFLQKQYSIVDDRSLHAFLSTFLQRSPADYSQFLTKVLRINPALRPTMKQVIELIKPYLPVAPPLLNGFEVQTPVYTANFFPVHQKVVLSFLSGVIFVKNVLLETVFLSVDLFHRFLPFYEAPGTDEGYNLRTYLLLIITSFLMAFKLVQDNRLDIEATIVLFTDHMRVGRDMLVPSKVIGLEKIIIKNLGGILYRKFLFAVCRNFEDLRDAFNFLSQSFYANIDVDGWIKTLPSRIPNISDKYLSYAEFVARTNR